MSRYAPCYYHIHCFIYYIITLLRHACFAATHCLLLITILYAICERGGAIVTIGAAKSAPPPALWLFTYTLYYAALRHTATETCRHYIRQMPLLYADTPYATLYAGCRYTKRGDETWLYGATCHIAIIYAAMPPPILPFIHLFYAYCYAYALLLLHEDITTQHTHYMHAASQPATIYLLVIDIIIIYMLFYATPHAALSLSYLYTLLREFIITYLFTIFTAAVILIVIYAVISPCHYYEDIYNMLLLLTIIIIIITYLHIRIIFRVYNIHLRRAYFRHGFIYCHTPFHLLCCRYAMFIHCLYIFLALYDDMNTYILHIFIDIIHYYYVYGRHAIRAYINIIIVIITIH